MATLRPAAVAGMFYPGEAAMLANEVQRMLENETAEPDPEPPRALVVPHAGYIYSGKLAARAYAHLKPWRQSYRRVLLLGPSHRVGFHGMALSGADYFTTPLGKIPLDRIGCAELKGMHGVMQRDDAHTMEHSLEVQLPFLQSVLGRFTLLPVVVGDADAEDVAAVIEHFWHDPQTLVVISTDLSHYLDDDTARRVDAETRMAVEHLDPEHIGYDQACGRNPLRGLLTVLRRHQRGITTLGMTNSSEASGDRDRVVGYGAWIVT